jgi:hypothetical protein
VQNSTKINNKLEKQVSVMMTATAGSSGQAIDSKTDEKISGAGGKNQSSLATLLNNTDQTIRRILSTVDGVLAMKIQKRVQTSFFSTNANNATQDKELQKNQLALHNASIKVQALYSNYNTGYEEEKNLFNLNLI